MTDQLNTTQNPLPNPSPSLEVKGSNIKDHIDQTSIDKLKSRMSLMTELGLLGIFLILGLIGMFGYLANSQVKQYQVNREQIAAAMFNGSDIQNTVTFLENQQNQIDIINKALPNEVGFIEFVRLLEALTNEYDVGSEFQFDKGKNLDGASYVPVTISLKTTSENIILYLEKLEKIPYLFSIDTITANKEVESEDNWNYVLSGKVFVSNNFRQN